MTRKHSILLILSVAVLGGWGGLGAEEVALAQATAEEPLPMSSALDLALDLEPPPKVEASCRKEACGNTGTLWGIGPAGVPDCVNARTDLVSKISAAANDICPGPVTGVTHHYDDNCQSAGGGNCTESGNADVECKICPGQSCGGMWE